jgi:hypothetical protein
MTTNTLLLPAATSAGHAPRGAARRLLDRLAARVRDWRRRRVAFRGLEAVPDLDARTRCDIGLSCERPTRQIVSQYEFDLEASRYSAAGGGLSSHLERW